MAATCCRANDVSVATQVTPMQDSAVFTDGGKRFLILDAKSRAEANFEVPAIVGHSSVVVLEHPTGDLVRNCCVQVSHSPKWTRAFGVR